MITPWTAYDAFVDAHRADLLAAPPRRRRVRKAADRSDGRSPAGKSLRARPARSPQICSV